MACPLGYAIEHAIGCPTANQGVIHGIFRAVPHEGEHVIKCGVVPRAIMDYSVARVMASIGCPWLTMNNAMVCAMGHPTT